MWLGKRTDACLPYQLKDTERKSNHDRRQPVTAVQTHEWDAIWSPNLTTFLSLTTNVIVVGGRKEVEVLYHWLCYCGVITVAWSPHRVDVRGLNRQFPESYENHHHHPHQTLLFILSLSQPPLPLYGSRNKSPFEKKSGPSTVQMCGLHMYSLPKTLVHFYFLFSHSWTARLSLNENNFSSIKGNFKEMSWSSRVSYRNNL